MGLEVLLCSQLSSTLFDCHIIHIKQRHLVQTDSFEESLPPSVIVEVAFVPRLNDHLTAAGHQLPLTHTFACIEATYMCYPLRRTFDYARISVALCPFDPACF